MCLSIMDTFFFRRRNHPPEPAPAPTAAVMRKHALQLQLKGAAAMTGGALQAVARLCRHPWAASELMVPRVAPSPELRVRSSGQNHSSRQYQDHDHQPKGGLAWKSVI